ncbi:MAG: hypothetical protein GEV11_17860 [Streptosporangiales bacterium]|nr:hypothetical protein [Streptosporangiales bacterium]
MTDATGIKEQGETRRGALLGAMFLMATAAIGPGFITQTTEFTVTLGAVFACAILVSILVDIAVQLNVWRIVGVSGRYAQDLGNKVAPGVGYALAVLIAFGGLVFNVGNVGGTALGMDALFGLEPKAGGVISAAVAIGIFLIRKAGVAMDRIVVVLGIVMILMTTYVAVVSGPPVGEALTNSVMPLLDPDTVPYLAITTLIGGTVGGYITYSGAHRMVDTGVTGVDNVKAISQSSVTGVLVTGVMRVLLFLAIFGVVAGGTVLGEENPARDAFGAAAGEIGVRVYGIVIWAAAITSVIAASYTTVSFFTTFSSWIAKHRNWVTVGFIVLTTIIFVIIGQAPVTLLVLAGSLNGLILPVGFAVLLWVAARRRDLMGDYRYPSWLLGIGVLAWLLTLYMGWNSLAGIAELWS